MISQIGRLGKVSFKVGLSAAALYAVGLVLGAGALGGALGGVGYLVRWVLGVRPGPWGPEVLLPLALLAFVGGLRDLGVLRVSFPQPYKQVPREWLHVFGPLRAGFLWGLAVGLGYTTLIQFSLYYVIALWALLSGLPAWGAGLLATYGVAQGLLLIAETVAVSSERVGSGGLFGGGRSRFLFPLGGTVLIVAAALIASSILLAPARAG